MVRTGWIVRLIGVAVMLAMWAASAVAQAPEPVGQQSNAQMQVRRADRENLRRQIYLMEGALARAVEYGAQLLNREIRTVSPEIVALAGNAKARGVYLEGYGVFFDVSVPVLLQSQMWAFRTMFDQNDPGLRDSIIGLQMELKETNDPSRRSALEYAIAVLRARANPLAPSGPRFPQAPAQPGAVVGAAMLSPETAPQSANPATTPLPSPTAAPTPNPPPAESARDTTRPMTIDRMWLENPDRAYTEQIRNALIDTMLDWSTPMPIALDEWLTVGAREDAQRDIFAPPELYDQVVTVVLRIKGSDLAAFRAGTIDRDEAKRRIQTREF